MKASRRISRTSPFRGEFHTKGSMRSRPALFASIVALTMSASQLGAQSPPQGWRNVLEDRIRPAYRYTHPELEACASRTDLPTVGRLSTTGDQSVVGRTWQAGPNQSRWEPLRSPVGTATLEVNIVYLTCSVTGRGLLVETDGYYLEIDATRLARVDDAGVVEPGIFLAISEQGTATPVRMRELCEADGCHWALADANQDAADIRAAIAARAEAERARLAEAQRRAEAQRAAISRAGANVGAQAAAVTQRQLIDAYQSYGATEDQARAIIAGRVLIGMTPAMVRAAIGTPAETRVDGTGTDARSTWIYPGMQLTIVGGKVSEIR